MATGNANLTAEAVFTGGGRKLPLMQRIIEAAERIWPRKPGANLAFYAGVTERAVRFWMAKNTGMKLESVAALLRTDDGFEILDAIMGDSKVRWWRVAKLAHEQDSAAQQIRAMERRLAKAKALRDSIEIE